MRTLSRRLAGVAAVAAAASICCIDPSGVIVQADSTMPAETPSGIPDGRYTRVATAADGVALGVEPAAAEAMVGPDGEMPLAIEIDRDRWRIMITNDAGAEEQGDLGTLSIDADGHVLLVSDSGGCPGCIQVIDWTLDGTTLSFALVPTDVREYPIEERFILEGEWVLEDEPAGTAAEGVVTFRFANLVDALPDQIVRFVAEVQRLSDGSMEFEFVNDYGAGASPGAEATTLADITSGAMDMGWIGARAVPAFEPLLAPMLVDSYDLEEAVFEAGVPERMLADLGEPGLVGITILPGPLRTVLGVTHPFVGPEDFDGQTVASDMVPLSELSMTTLGAIPVPGAQGLGLDGLDGVQAQLAAITGNGYHAQADSVTANLNLWPRPLVIVVNADVFASLTPEQQEILMTAGANAVEPAMEASRNENILAVPTICASQLDVLDASGADLAALREAFQPVYDSLAQDPAKAAYLDEIAAIKDELGAPPESFTCD